MGIGREGEFGLLDQKKKQMMKIVCAWCGKEQGEKESEMGGISHGICPECKIEVMKEIDEVKNSQKQPR